MLDARTHHAERSLLGHAKDSRKPIYTIGDLISFGWEIERMVSDYRDFMLGKCPGQCGRYAIDIPSGEISVDIIEPTLKPVWGVNTRFMCKPDNGRKGAKTRQQLIDAEIQRLKEQQRPSSSTTDKVEWAVGSLFRQYDDEEGKLFVE